MVKTILNIYFKNLYLFKLQNNLLNHKHSQREDELKKPTSIHSTCFHEEKVTRKNLPEGHGGKQRREFFLRKQNQEKSVELIQELRPCLPRQPEDSSQKLEVSMDSTGLESCTGENGVQKDTSLGRQA